MKTCLGNLAKGAQIGAGFCIVIATVWTAVTFGAAAWWALPNAGATLSSAAWNDIVSQLNALAGTLNVTGGNVGVGKTAPDVRLDVNGEMIRNVFYLEPGTTINQSFTTGTWNNLPGGWGFTYQKKSATSKLLITVNAVVRGTYQSNGWTHFWLNVAGTNYDLWGNYTTTADLHTPGMYRRAISGLPKGNVSIQWIVYPENSGYVCVWCIGTPNVTIEEIY